MRDSIENAFYAFVALSPEDREKMVRRFNDFQSGRAHPAKLEYTPSFVPPTNG